MDRGGAILSTGSKYKTEATRAIAALCPTYQAFGAFLSAEQKNAYHSLYQAAVSAFEAAGPAVLDTAH